MHQKPKKPFFEEDIWMAKKPMEKWSTSLAIIAFAGKCKLNHYGLEFHYIPVRMAKMKNSDNTKRWWGCWETESLIHCWQECKREHVLWKSLAVPLKIKHTLPIWPSSCIPRHSSRAVKTHIYTKSYVRSFIIALFVITPNWKEPKRLSIGESVETGSGTTIPWNPTQK